MLTTIGQASCCISQTTASRKTLVKAALSCLASNASNPWRKAATGLETLLTQFKSTLFLFALEHNALHFSVSVLVYKYSGRHIIFVFDPLFKPFISSIAQPKCAASRPENRRAPRASFFHGWRAMPSSRSLDRVEVRARPTRAH